MYKTAKNMEESNFMKIIKWQTPVTKTIFLSVEVE
jgi:hypothetical protein